jgi:hypothetical protein
VRAEIRGSVPSFFQLNHGPGIVGCEVSSVADDQDVLIDQVMQDRCDRLWEVGE